MHGRGSWTAGPLLTPEPWHQDRDSTSVRQGHRRNLAQVTATVPVWLPCWWDRSAPEAGLLLEPRPTDHWGHLMASPQSGLWDCPRLL